MVFVDVFCVAVAFARVSRGSNPSTKSGVNEVDSGEENVR
jgi:hypothetical protein